MLILDYHFLVLFLLFALPTSFPIVGTDDFVCFSIYCVDGSSIRNICATCCLYI